MALPELVQDIVDWCDVPVPGQLGKAHALLATLYSGEPQPELRSSHQGLLVYHPTNDTELVGRLVGTLVRTRSVSPAGMWGRVTIEVRRDGGLVASARFLGEFDGIEPAESIGVPTGAIDRFDAQEVVQHFNSSVDHFIMRLRNNWLVAYAKRDLTP